MRTTENQNVWDLLKNSHREESASVGLAALLGRVPNFDLACVGISLNGRGAMTFEALSYLIAAEIVYCYPPTPAHYDLIRLFNSNAVNLNDTHYTRGSAFDVTYDAIVREVMTTVQSGRRVAYATQGSPVFHCGTAVSLHRKATKAGLVSVLVGGISSFELLCAELVPDYDIRSIQICSSVSLFHNDSGIDPRRPCLLFDLGRLIMNGIRETKKDLNSTKLAQLGEKLRQEYGGDHEIILMNVRADGICSRTFTKLCDFEDSQLKCGYIGTMFLPAL